jgi:hypothetical protein
VKISELTLDEGHFRFASPAQTEILQAYLDNGGNVRGAARVCNRHHKTVQKALIRLHQKAQIQGYAPEQGIDMPVPSMFFMERLTLNTDADGKIKQAWPKLKIDDAKWVEFIQQRREQVLVDYPLQPLPTVPMPAEAQKDILPWFNIGDAHLNMLAHAMSTGRAFSLEDAAAELMEAFEILIHQTPPAHRAVLNDLGDFTHHDNLAGVTSHSGHLLDCDQSYGSMLEVSTELFERIILRMLEKFENVDVIINQGNHSGVNDLWMAVYLRSRFRDNPRVCVIDNNRVFIPYRFGEVLILNHHGHRCPDKRLADVMITDLARDFGETQFHYIYKGHVHHKAVSKEYAGLEIESFNNLAPNDRHHYESGWRSKNAITRVDHHRRFGEVGRRKLPLEEIHDSLCSKGAFPVEMFEVNVTRR